MYFQNTNYKRKINKYVYKILHKINYEDFQRHFTICTISLLYNIQLHHFLEGLVQSQLKVCLIYVDGTIEIQREDVSHLLRTIQATASS